MNNRCLLFLLPLAALMALGVSGMLREGCDPADCSGKNPGDMVADPMNCTQFYFCLDDGVVLDKPYPCPDAGGFDPNAGVCTDNTTCAAPCQPSCKMTCSGTPLEKIGDPKDCNKYYVCAGEDAVGPFPCPAEKPYFDGTECGGDFSKCCEIICVPYCPADAGDVPDPLDCTRYYECTAAGLIADDAGHKSCPAGENFDIPTGKCTADAPCKTLCGGAEGTTEPVDGSVSVTGITPTSGCLASLTCTELGYFPKCTTCQQEYFHCTAVGQPAATGKCSGTLVFNPDPDFPYCVLPSNCPYHPPI
ncbi:uncharacterized protein [Panulirus ornatus]|uniref:uncharacterized protein n=1 Tax=Panulirus ornatus TaxID=150431 RepID=UPI003A8B2E52